MPETYQDLEPGYTQPEPDVENSYLWDWVFHYNPYTGLWNAIPREFYVHYWNTTQTSDKILRSKHLGTLIDLLHKSKGDPEIINQLTTNVR